MGRSLLVVAGILVWAGVASAQPKTWEYNGRGKWTPASTPATRPAVQIISNPILDRAERLLDGRQIRAAHDIIIDWVKKDPAAADRDRGLYLLAECYFANGDRLWCFYQCDELLEKYPDSRLFFPALELQFRVADAFLSGYRKKFLGLAIQNMEDEAIEMLFRIQERSPGSPIAERALLRTADFYYHTSQFDLAADAYGAYARNYPRSPDVPRIKLQQAFASLAQFRGPKYDATPLIDAKAMFSEISERYPELAREENLGEFVERIDNTLATKLYATADYYRRVGQLRHAVFAYRSLAKTYPNSRVAGMAKDQIAKMPRWALAQPDAPPASEGPPIAPMGPPVPTTRGNAE